jgi:hypothetical protein
LFDALKIIGLFAGVVIKTWKPFHYQNITYNLIHLDEFEWEFVQSAKDNKPEIRYSFVIEFGLHCFTRGLNLHQKEKWEKYSKRFNLF